MSKALKIGFLDDLDMRHLALITPRNQRAELNLLHFYNGESLVAHMTKEKERFDLLFLDHDLAPSHYPEWDKTYREKSRNQEEGGKHFMNGKEVCHFLGTLPAELRPLTIVVHSQNHQASPHMEAILKGHRYAVLMVPFSFDKDYLKACIERSLAA